ncbi:methyltransferase domain-containing protein [Alteromonas sp. a30]|uniref:methyltransferase domain-containing protein n=1 Tax=Alteromonas sp. a30 TaxID=2730917 RepID=UPI00227E6067|nr:methyltransferase domain-containing protein [Alteromonas sp. a30]MCY7296384.1 methyltransferase domain-containing protein [Alteromonas sp. a30]
MKNDRNFDDLAQKFDANIYGTSKGRLRHELLLHHLHNVVLVNNKPRNILDAGGGTGEMTRSLLALGHKVTLNDLSADSLDIAKDKCRLFPDVNYSHSSIHNLPKTQRYDLVICHAVLEWASDQQQLLLDLIELTEVGGHISLSFYNYDAQLFSNMVYGNFEFVAQGMKKRNQVRLTPHSPAKPQNILSLLEQLPVNVVHKAGIRCFHDYVREKQLPNEKYDSLFQLEAKYGLEDPYLWLGKYFHIVIKRSA